MNKTKTGNGILPKGRKKPFEYCPRRVSMSIKVIVFNF